MFSSLVLGPVRALAVESGDHQAVVANVQALLEGLALAGQPLSPLVVAKLHEAASTLDPVRSLKQIRETLSPYVICRVAINAEGRLNVSRGDLVPELIEGGWRAFCTEITNESNLTSALRVSSPEAKEDFAYSPGSSMTATGLTPRSAAHPLQTITPLDVEQRWLALSLQDSPSGSKDLEGLSLEYRILLLYSRDSGKRSANLTFEAGSDSLDLGHRSTVQMLFRCQPASELKLRILEEDGAATSARLIISDSEGRIYPLQAKRSLPDFGFQKQIYRRDGGSLRLPEGGYTIDYCRGPEYVEKVQQVELSSQSATETTLRLQRWINPEKLGWYSGDHHIHAAGCAHYTTPSEGVRPQDIVEQVRGEGLSVGDVLSWGPSWYHQKQFFRPGIDQRSGQGTLLKYDVEISGFPSSHCGHLCLLALRAQDFPGTNRIEDWPSWNLPILRWARTQGAAVGYAHIGHGLSVDSSDLPNYLIPPFDDNGANEYLIDVVHDAVDFLSVVDTPPAAELNLWYHALNCGFRTRIAGETDFPCLFERVGMGRSYVHLEEPPVAEAGYQRWIEGLVQGRSYVSEGKSHLMDFELEGTKLSGRSSEFRTSNPGVFMVRVGAAALCSGELAEGNPATPGQPLWDANLACARGSREVQLQLIVNGRPVKSVPMPADGQLRRYEWQVHIDKSSWIAFRIFPSSHTNPIFVTVNDLPVRASRRSAAWCVESIEHAWKRLVKQIRPSELDAAQAACDRARKIFEGIHELAVDDRVSS